MLDWTQEKLEEYGAKITTNEIMQQPNLWKEAYNNYESNKDEIELFINNFSNQFNEKTKVIFTGAGTSAYAGDVVVPHLNRYGNTSRFDFEAIATTDIVSAPYAYLNKVTPTLLVSLARSGNSPESIAAVEVANQVCDNIQHFYITCAADGSLALSSEKDSKSFLLLMPSKSNDQGFAMTGSFSCMALSALLIFDTVTENKKTTVEAIISMGKQVLDFEEKIQMIVNKEFNRVVYLGSGSLGALTREAQLKLLELTAGKIATAFDTSMGFRHGPKSFIDNQTLVFGFISNDSYTKQYDEDILSEIYGNQIAVDTVAIAKNESSFSDEKLIVVDPIDVSDGYLALPFVMVAQLVSLLTSIKVGNRPDTPSPSGTVNRVVKGVTIHSLEIY